MKQKIYKEMGYKRINFFKGVGSLFGKKGKAEKARAKKLKIPGNLKGDGFQMGGLIIVDKDGKVLVSFKQADPVDFYKTEDILKTLGISAPVPEGAVGGAAEPAMVCDDQACAAK